jgi:hypothetical protein
MPVYKDLLEQFFTELSPHKYIPEVGVDFSWENLFLPISAKEEVWIDQQHFLDITQVVSRRECVFDFKKTETFSHQCWSEIRSEKRRYQVSSNGRVEILASKELSQLIGLETIRFIQEGVTAPEVFLRLGFGELLAVGIAKIKRNGSVVGFHEASESAEDLVDNANVVYILGTSVWSTALYSTFLETKPHTQFRFIFASLPEQAEDQLEEALSIIHNTPIRGHLDEAKRALDIRKNTLSNVDYKTIQFVPPFSAILAIGDGEDGEPWGRLQVDHYLLRTSPASRLWLVIEGPGSILFDRYHALIEDIWHNPGRYDVRTANISLKSN